MKQRASTMPWLLISSYFVLATVFFTWPAVLHLRSSVLGQLGDNMQYVWQVGWFSKVLFQEPGWPFFDPYLNYPEGWSLARSEIALTQSLIGIPFGWLGGAVFGYNIAALSTFILTGLTTSIWVSRMSQDRVAGVMAGTLFAFTPFRIAHYRAGHLNLLGTMWLPLFFMAFFAILAGQSRSRWTLLVGGASLGLTALSSMYYFMLTIVACCLVAAMYLGLWNRPRLFDRSFWSDLGALGLFAFPLSAFGVFPYLRLNAQESLPDRSVAAVSGGSASVTDFLLPSTDHFLWGRWIGETFSRDHWIEGTLYLGLVAAAVVVAGLTIRRFREDRSVPLLVLLLATGGILALGTHLFWDERLVRMELFEPLGSLFGRENTAIPMPGYFMVKYLPFYSKMRSFKRVGVLAILGMAALAGLGFSTIRRKVSGRNVILVSVLILCLLVLDIYPGPFGSFAEVLPRAADLWLQGQTGSGAVAEFPFHLVEDQTHVYFAQLHGKPYLGGFFNAFPPAQYRRISPILSEFPDLESIALLRDLGVRYVVVDLTAFEDTASVESELISLGLQEIAHLEGPDIYGWEDADLRKGDQGTRSE